VNLSGSAEHAGRRGTRARRHGDVEHLTTNHTGRRGTGQCRRIRHTRPATDRFTDLCDARLTSGQIRPVIQNGATVMDGLFGERGA
jgi:hypothetical protein